MELSYEQIAALAKLVTEKDALDWITAATNVLLSTLILLLGFYTFFKSPQQQAKSKIHEKEVEMLYKAFDHFLIFSDTMTLYFSNKDRKFKRLQNNETLEQSFTDKEISSSDAVYNAFRDFNIALYTLRAIGDLTTEAKLKDFKDRSLKLREAIIECEIGKANAHSEASIGPVIHSERAIIESIKLQCFDSISAYKDRLKKHL